MFHKILGKKRSLLRRSRQATDCILWPSFPTNRLFVTIGNAHNRVFNRTSVIQFTPSNREYSLLHLSDVKRATDATKGSGVGKIFVFEK